MLRLFLVGCGKMGEALLQGWLRSGISPAQIRIRTGTPESATALAKRYNITAEVDLPYADESVVVFAVKPQILSTVLAAEWPKSALYLSIAAGKTAAFFEQAMGDGARVVRAMPNTPALVEAGITALSMGTHATQEDKKRAESLFAGVGRVLWLEEAKMDAATAISGSGPAYFYYFAECLLQAAEEIGLTREEAHTLVAHTLKGSAILAEREAWAFKTLRENVTSKGGVTQAALEVLQDSLPATCRQAISANLRRAGELAE